MSATTTTTTTTSSAATASVEKSGSSGKQLGQRPIALSHYVLNTTGENFEAMKAFYKNMLGGHASWENEIVSFITYDEEHHRVAIARFGGATKPRDRQAAGLNHVSFTFASLLDLAHMYLHRKREFGYEPHTCLHHGVTISLYYADPDGNDIECQLDCFKTAEESIAYMDSAEFAESPIGHSFNAAEFVEKILKANGDPEEEKKLLKRPSDVLELRIQ